MRASPQDLYKTPLGVVGVSHVPAAGASSTGADGATVSTAKVSLLVVLELPKPSLDCTLKVCVP